MSPHAQPSISLSTNCLYHLPLRVSLRLIAGAGFDGVELAMSPEVWLRGVDHVRRLARRFGLAVTAVHQSPLGFCPRGWSEESLIPDAAEAALALESPCVVVHYPLNACPPVERKPRWMAAVEAARHRLRGSPTRLTLENQGTCLGRRAGRHMERLARLVTLARREELHVTLDASHLGTAGSRLLEALRLMRPVLAHVHLSDFRPPSTVPPVPPLVRKLLSQHQMPGRGVLPLGPFLRQLARQGYDGAVTAEVNPVALGAWSPLLLRRRLRSVVRFLRSGLR